MSRGSEWRRWDPHTHTPDTLLNNQFSGPDPWENFLLAYETSKPEISALGITDYYTLDAYEKVLEKKKLGRLGKVDLIFPNVELRLDVATSTGSGVNAHLLVSPDDVNHLTELKRFLNNLTFTISQDTYRCNKEDLIKLGKFHERNVNMERRALEIGANQFKVNFSQLNKEYSLSEWAQKNILLAVSGNTSDGTSGLRNEDASFTALRTEIERCCHVIFSSHEKQRAFWLGHGAASKTVLEEKWNGCKPCLHGSDAHEQATIGKPVLDRFTWIKSDCTFEALRQACIEPETRVFIGKEPPASAIPSCVIESVVVSDASWLASSRIPLNSGLVAIIGARGSGKTALADLIAAGGHSLSIETNDRSFIKRASSLLTNEVVTLNWGSGNPTQKKLMETENFSEAKVQYLSQQFVDQLCSSEGLTDELMSEIERVMFQAHSTEGRMGCASFDELLDMRSKTSRETRKFHEQAISDIANDIANERDKKDNLPNLEKQLVDKTSAVETDKKDRQELVSNTDGSKENLHASISQALDIVRLRLEKAQRKQQALQAIKEEVENLKSTSFPSHLNKLKEKHAEAGLSDEKWQNFLLKFTGDVDTLVSEEILGINSSVNTIKGHAQVPLNATNLTTSYVPDGGLPEEQSFNILSAEQSRLLALMGIDRDISQKFLKLSERIQKEEAEIGNIKRLIESAEKATDRMNTLRAQRESAYQNIFEAILKEENELVTLYKPLMERLKNETGTLGKLTFRVQRTADVERWANEGENLLDLRKAGPFKGKGALLDAAKNELQNAWEIMSSKEISEAMIRFFERHSESLIAHAPVEKINKTEYKSWGKQVMEWLYSTAHISINYGVQYDNVNIQQLSPGTRGIVLLLLYLAIDREDDRPLIIDQPEENLDPKSIFDELVKIFREAKLRRQIIIVTHNANLVVNTDADQVIVATCGSHRPGKLPLISYLSGGLENDEIRKNVCEILEGGEAAFKERARRLRVSLTTLL